MNARRDQILDAAARLFRQYGPLKTTIADIARAADVGVGSVYLEFPNKDALLLAISEARHARILQAIEVAWRGPGTAEARLQSALTARLDAFLECASEGLHSADLVHCGACGPVQRAHRAFREAERELFTLFLHEGREVGAFQIREPAHTAYALLLCYEAFSPPGVYACDQQRLRSALSEVHRLVLCGLLSR